MDIQAIAGAITILKTAIETIKQSKDLLPESPKKTQVNAALEQAERQLKIAEAETAKALGYELCRNHMPPEIMFSKDDAIWICAQCGNRKDKSFKAFVV